MYIDLNGKKLKEDWKHLIKEAEAEDPNNKNIAKDERLLINEESEISFLEFDEEEEEISFGVTNKYGYFSYHFPLNEDLMFDIVNCLKSKGSRIQKLIDLNK